MSDVAQILIEEHHEIDAGIEEFQAALERGEVTPGPLTSAIAALRRHIYLEEELLFPAIRRAGMTMPIFVMIREHGEVWALMDQIEESLSAPDPDLNATRLASKQLLVNLMHHNTKEEPIIYPQTDVDLAPEELNVLADFIATGAMPDGWVCEAAR